MCGYLGLDFHGIFVSLHTNISHVRSPFMNLLFSLLLLLKLAFHADNLRVKYEPYWNDSSPPRHQVVSSHLHGPCFSMLGRFWTAGLTKSQFVCILQSRRFIFWSRAHLFREYIVWHSQRLESQISTTGIILPSLCWSCYCQRGNRAAPHAGWCGWRQCLES